MATKPTSKKSAPKKSAKKAVTKKKVATAEAKVSVPKTKKEKVAIVKQAAEKVTLSPRERFLNKFCQRHNLTIPPQEVMFATQIAKGLPRVPLAKLAVFCKAAKWIKSKGALGGALDEVAGYFGDDNFLNLSAEVDPKQVEKVIKDILEYGSLIHDINATKVTDVPENIQCDPSVEQVWDGRHRTVGLAIIYGETLELPVESTTMPFLKALYACVVSNDTRPIKKLEGIHFQGIKDGTDASVAYNKKKGNLRQIAKFIAAHALKQTPVPALRLVERVPVFEKLKGQKGMTAVNFTNAIRDALTILTPRINLVHLDKKTISVFNVITECIEHTFLAIDTRSGGKKVNTAWNAYSSPVLGRCIGRAIDSWIVGRTTIKNDLIKEFADQLAQVAIGYMDHAAELYARTPSNDLESRMLTYADEKLSIILPRVEADLFIEDASTPEPVAADAE